ncbi:MAG TPA: serine hydrolase domain-containing protein [Candidatus Kapabacteria bacterium]|nr:serine hydrolase domain-containing protein [Candidatus Kapabacteria bacterium]
MHSTSTGKIIILSFLFIYFLGLQPVSGWDKTGELDTLLNDLNKEGQFNGAVLIAKNGEIVFKKACGIANSETKTPLTTATPFNLASLAKQFTAMGIMILAEKGKLKYDDSIAKYLPELNFYKAITIRRLLNHTGGLSEYSELFEKYRWDTAKTADNDDLIALLKKHLPAPLFGAGSQYLYSNTGYALLASIIQKVSGQPYETFLKQNIFEPLGMRNSFAYNLKMKQSPGERAKGFIMKNTTPSPFDLTYMDGIMGDGNIYSSAEDLFIWDQALYTEKLVKKATLDQAYTPGRLNDGSLIDYGFGWLLSGDQKSVRHQGAWVGFRTFIYRDLSLKNTLIILDNSTNRYFSQITRTLFEYIIE